MKYRRCLSRIWAATSYLEQNLIIFSIHSPATASTVNKHAKLVLEIILIILKWQADSLEADKFGFFS
jgi:hypothetical protein